MIKFLNAHPLFTFILFKKYVNKFLEKKNKFYEPNGKKCIDILIIYGSPHFFIKRIIYSPCIYLDGIFINIKEYYQLLVLLFYDEITNKKLLAAYILWNSNLKNHILKYL